jgi:hypothetical protein
VLIIEACLWIALDPDQARSIPVMRDATHLPDQSVGGLHEPQKAIFGNDNGSVVKWRQGCEDRFDSGR